MVYSFGYGVDVNEGMSNCLFVTTMSGGVGDGGGGVGVVMEVGNIMRERERGPPDH